MNMIQNQLKDKKYNYNNILKRTIRYLIVLPLTLALFSGYGCNSDINTQLLSY